MSITSVVQYYIPNSMKHILSQQIFKQYVKLFESLVHDADSKCAHHK